jgi:hypothetical protein
VAARPNQRAQPYADELRARLRGPTSASRGCRGQPPASVGQGQEASRAGAVLGRRLGARGLLGRGTASGDESLGSREGKRKLKRETTRSNRQQLWGGVRRWAGGRGRRRDPWERRRLGGGRGRCVAPSRGGEKE